MLRKSHSAVTITHGGGLKDARTKDVIFCWTSTFKLAFLINFKKCFEDPSDCTSDVILVGLAKINKTGGRESVYNYLQISKVTALWQIELKLTRQETITISSIVPNREIMFLWVPLFALFTCSHKNSPALLNLSDMSEPYLKQPVVPFSGQYKLCYSF